MLGLLAGLLTAWVERTLIGAEGADFELSIVERCLLAGRAIWFYLDKLFWPTGLIFIYPRWHVSQAVWWQYLFPAAALLLLAGCWTLRRRWRGPLAGLLFFVGTLLPALGFCNVFPFIYSFVADHFQYLASLGVITLVAAGVTLLLRRERLWNHPVGYAVCLVLLVSLGILTWRQNRMYSDIDSLYLTTIARNPDCWLAQNNLGLALANRGQFDEAIGHYQKVLEIKPDCVEALDNLGVALFDRGRLDEAMAQYRKAMELKPGYAGAYNNLGLALASRGQIDEAIAHYRKATELKPAFADAYNNLGIALAGRGQVQEAIGLYQKVLELNPYFAQAHHNWALALASVGRLDEAAAHYQQGLKINPHDAKAHFLLGRTLAGLRRIDEAIAHYRRALEIEPGYAEAHANLGNALLSLGQRDQGLKHLRKVVEISPADAVPRNNLGVVLATQGRFDEALLQFQQALQIQPDYAEARKNLAWLRATCPEASLRNGVEAIEHARRADQFCGGKRVDVLNVLAAAYAEAERFPEALTTARKALDLATRQKAQAWADVLRKQIALYEAGKPYREMPSASPPAPSKP